MQPLDVVEHVTARSPQRNYTRELMTEILDVQLGGQAAHADVEGRTTVSVSEVHVALGLYQKLNYLMQFPVSSNMYRSLAAPIMSTTEA